MLDREFYITSFHIFASTAIGDSTSTYAKMLKSTAYLQPSKELTLPQSSSLQSPSYKVDSIISS